MPGQHTRTTKRGSSSRAPSTTTTGSGWDVVAQKKKQNEDARENAKSSVFDVIIKDGESTIIQFLEEEPLCLDVHSVKIDGKWKTIPCQKASKRNCTLCEDGIKTSWKAAFLVLDYRGEWDKDKGKNKNTNKRGEIVFPLGKPVERRLLASNQLALAIKAQKEKTGTITKFLYELSRTGATAKDTNYAITRALDPDEERPIKTLDWDTKADLSESCKPPTDEQLAKMGYDGSYAGADDDEDKPKGKAKPRSTRYSDDDEE